jgi:hypothetical protein
MMQNGLNGTLRGLLGTAALLAVGGVAQAAGELDLSTSELTLQPKPLKLVQAPPAAQDDDWHIVTRMGLWATSLKGDAGAGGHSADVDASFSDLLDKTNFAVSPGIEFGKGKLAFALNGFLSQLESDVDFAGTLPNGTPVSGGGEVTADMYIGDFAVGYTLLEVPVGDTMMLSVTPGIGVRYTYMKVEVDPDRHPSRDASEDWWDPYLATRVNLQITKALAWRTDGSVGGFGVGSDFAWHLQTLLDWRFSRRFELNVGYRAVGCDYENGGFKWDVTMHGPWIGLSTHLK